MPSPKSGFAAGDPADDGAIEKGRQALVEELALLAHRAGPDELFRVDAMQAGKQVACGDEAAEQTGAIDVAAKDADAAAAGHVAAVPVAARCRVELRRNEEIEGLDVGGRALGRQEPRHVLVARQVAEGRELEAVQRDVVRVEVDHVDPARAGRQIGQHVAAAGADGDDPMLRAGCIASMSTIGSSQICG